MPIASRLPLLGSVVLLLSACGSTDPVSSRTMETISFVSTSTTSAPDQSDRDAGPEVDGPSDSTDPEMPDDAGPVGSDDPTIITEPPPTTIATPATTVDAEPPSDIAALVLGPDDVGSDWELLESVAYEPIPQNAAVGLECHAAQSIDDSEAIYEWRTTWGRLELGEPMDTDLGQAIGRARSAGTASAIVRLFSRLPDCDLSPGTGEGAIVDGGLVDIAGSTVATELRIEDGSHVTDLFLIAIDDILFSVSVQGRESDIDDLALEMATRAVAKIRSS